MDWEKHLKALSGYDIAFEIKQGYYHVSLKYEKDWNVITPENDCIYVEERNGIYHYIASTDSVTVNDIFKAIDATIEYNQDLQKKLELFKKKTEELRDIFAKENLDVLETIEFKYGKKTTRRRHKKTPIKNENEVVKNVNNELKSSEEENDDKLNMKENQDNNSNTPLTAEEQNVQSNEIIEDDEIVPMDDEYMEELERK